MDDINAAIAKGLAQAISDLGKDILSALRRAGRSEIKKLSIDFETGFRKFLDRNFKKYSKIKTLLNSSSPISLELVFESPNLSVDDKIIDEDAFLDLIDHDNFVVITGAGGSGKSIFLKHIFVRFYNEARGRIPFLVELRNVPHTIGLKEYMFDLLKVVSLSFDQEMFEYALKSGKFIFLFDGFDEVDHARRELMAKEMLDLAYAYGDNLIIVSSRPDEIFNGFNEFTIARMTGFTKPQVVSLISKVKYDRQAKAAFLKLVRDGGLYESHTSYLSNPLLCNIMLLTHDYGAEIPQKMHLFLGQTFDVLFFRHDATKGSAFRRKFHTSLSIDDFRLSLSAFSAFSYSDFGPSMKQSQALLAAKKSLEYCGFAEKADHFLLDLCSSLSLMVREGDVYSYIHRTFQEYFFAVFLATENLDSWGEVVEKVLKERPNDNVIQLLNDINRDRFEQEFLAPRIKAVRKALEEIDIERNAVAAFNLFYLGMNIRIDEPGPRIDSWLIGKDNIRPPFYLLIRFLRQGSMRLPGDFDWITYAKRHKLEVIDGREVVLESITNALLSGMPLVAFLEDMKAQVITMDNELADRANSRRQLLSDMLFRKKPDSST